MKINPVVSFQASLRDIGYQNVKNKNSSIIVDGEEVKYGDKIHLLNLKTQKITSGEFWDAYKGRKDEFFVLDYLEDGPSGTLEEIRYYPGNDNENNEIQVLTDKGLIKLDKAIHKVITGKRFLNILDTII